MVGVYNSNFVYFKTERNKYYFSILTAIHTMKIFVTYSKTNIILGLPTTDFRHSTSEKLRLQKKKQNHTKKQKTK